MPEHGWLEINDFRTFPLVTADSRMLKPACTTELPRRGLSDAGFMLGVSSQFVVGMDTVNLYSVRVTFTGVDFDFRSSAPGMAGYRWLFSFLNGTAYGCTAQVDATAIVGGTPDPDRGWGFMTIGDLKEIVALGPGLFELCTPPRVEPALIQSLLGTYVRTINVGNTERRCPTKCCETPVPFDTEKVYMLKEGIVGDVRFREGHNTQINVVVSRNLIELSAIAGAGTGETCVDYLVTADGQAGLQEDDGTLCESCDDYIRSINGVRTQDGKLVLSGSAGVKITSDQTANKLTVGVESDRLCQSSL
jgi:hypothetical protein